MAEEVRLTIDLSAGSSGQTFDQVLDRAANAAERLDRALRSLTFEGAARQRGLTDTEVPLVPAWMSERVGAAADFGNTVGNAANQAARSLNALQDSTMTASQRMMHFTEGLPVIGGLIGGLRRLADAVSGVADRIERSERVGHMVAVGQSLALDATMRRYGGLTHSGELAAIAGAWRGAAGAGFAGLGVADVGNIMDPLQMASWERRAAIASQRPGLQAAIAEAEARQQGIAREASVLQKQREGALAAMRGAEGRENEARSGALHHFNLLSGGMAAGGQRATEAEAARERANAAQNLAEIEQKITENKERGSQAALDLEQRRNALVKNTIQMEQERLQTLRGQESIVRGQQQTWGGMVGAEKAHALSLMRKLRDRGIAGMAQGEWQWLAGHGGAFDVQRGLEVAAENDPSFREFQAASPFGPRGTLTEMGRGIQDAQKRLLELTMKNEAALSEAISKTFDTWQKAIIDALIRAVEGRMRALEAQVQAAMRVRGAQ